MTILLYHYYDDISSKLDIHGQQETIVLSEEIIGYSFQETNNIVLLWQDGDNVKRLKTDIDFPQDELVYVAKSLLHA